MTFTEEWIERGTLHEMQRMVASVKELRGDIIEFGCWEGRSLVHLANAAHPETVHAVDHWQGSLLNPIDVFAPDRDIRAIFDTNVAELTQGNVTVHEMSTIDFQAWYTGPGVKFLHIDADHDYELVADDIRWGLDKLVPGGIICGDDYSGTWPGVVQAVNELLPTVNLFNHMWFWRLPSN